MKKLPLKHTKHVYANKNTGDINDYSFVDQMIALTNICSIKLKKTMPLDIQYKFLANVPKNKSTNILIIDLPELLPILKYNNYTNVTIIDTASNNGIAYVANHLGYSYKEINAKEIKELHMSKKFDVILGNPPYNGTLHLHFFNKCAEDFLVDNGKLVFIQPAIAYYYNANKPKPEIVNMLKNVKQHTSKVEMLQSNTFPTVAIGYDLSVTTITKDNKNSGSINEFNFIDGETLKNVDVEGIAYNQANPEIVKSTTQKINKLINDNSTILSNLISNNSSKGFVNIGELRGSRVINFNSARVINNRSSDFFTLVKKDMSDYNTGKYGIDVITAENAQNLISYLKSTFVRYCTSLQKYNVSIHFRGSSTSSGYPLYYVPMLDMSRSWSDEELFKLAGFTKEEIAEVYRVIPDYY